MLQAAREDRPNWQAGELESAIISFVVGAILIVLVYRYVQRHPWPRPLKVRFVARHLVTAPLAALTWFLVSRGLVALFLPEGQRGDSSNLPLEMTIIGCFFYFVVVFISYSAQGAARAAEAEAIAASTQLSALRAQLQPHFLFNALHTVVQLIHIDPRKAAEAAELVADLLRRTIEEKRDEVTLGEEWRFVSRYLAMEQMRFGERLIVRQDLPEDLLDERVPSFALQTLVENAVRHGAAPRVAPTEIAITGSAAGGRLLLSVRNSGDAVPAAPAETGVGTGLIRLRQRLSVLYGSGGAELTCGPVPGGGFDAMLSVPRRNGRHA